MNKKLAGLFLLLAILPSALLVWLGRAGMASEEERNRRRIAGLCGEKLAVEREKARALFDRMEKELLAFRGVKDAEDARARTRKSAYVRQVFAIDAKGKTVYPSEELPLSESERDFIARTKELGLSPGLFLSRGEDSAGKAGAESGWYTWYLVDGANFIFWMKAPAAGGFVPGGIIGLELNRMAVLKAVLGAFPDTGEGDGGFRVVLADIGGKTLYQWGSYGPRADEVPIAETRLDVPLSSWRLKFFSAPETLELPGSSLVPIAASIGLLVLAVAGLSLYLYRESTREIRDALEKVSFVNQVSHELKTPLTNIRLYAELLKEGLDEGDESAAAYLAVIDSESGRLARLIGNVLTFAKESRHGLVLNPTPAIPEESVRKAAGSFLPSFEAKGIRLELDLAAPERAVLDPDIVEQIVNNLLSNGEKYAASGRFIGLSLRREDGDLVLRASDRGPGIPAKLRDKIFLPFFRISDRSTEGVTGAGIGLAVVRSLARLHGGDARVVPSDTGAVFEVRLRAPVSGLSEERTGGTAGGEET